MHVPAPAGQKMSVRPAACAVARPTVGIGPRVLRWLALNADLIVWTPDRLSGRGEPGRYFGLTPPALPARNLARWVAGAVPAAAGVQHFHAPTTAALDDRDDDTGHQPGHGGGPRARASTAAGQPRPHRTAPHLPPHTCAPPGGPPLPAGSGAPTSSIVAVLATATSARAHPDIHRHQVHALAPTGQHISIGHQPAAQPAGAASARPRSTAPCSRPVRHQPPADHPTARAPDPSHTAGRPHHRHPATSPAATTRQDADTPPGRSPPAPAADDPAQSAEPDTAATREYAAVWNPLQGPPP